MIVNDSYAFALQMPDAHPHELTNIEKQHVAYVGHVPFKERKQQIGAGYESNMQQRGGDRADIIDDEKVIRAQKIKTPEEQQAARDRMRKQFIAYTKPDYKRVKSIKYEIKKINDQKGYGLFTKNDIPANVILMPYRGFRISNRIANRLANREGMYVVPGAKIDRRGKPAKDRNVSIDGDYAVVGNNKCTIASLVNDNDWRPGVEKKVYEKEENANVALEPHFVPPAKNKVEMYLVSTKEIKKGEELSYNYGLRYWLPPKDKADAIKRDRPEYGPQQDAPQPADEVIDNDREEDTDGGEEDNDGGEEDIQPDMDRQADLEFDDNLPTREITIEEKLANGQVRVERKRVRNNVYVDKHMKREERRRRGPRGGCKMEDVNVKDHQAKRYKCDKRRVNGKITNVNCGMRRVDIAAHRGYREKCPPRNQRR